jgi:dihydroneopterin aldolase
VVLSHAKVTKAVVTIHKPNAPIDLAFDDVSVTIERSR